MKGVEGATSYNSFCLPQTKNKFQNSSTNSLNFNAISPSIEPLCTTLSLSSSMLLRSFLSSVRKPQNSAGFRNLRVSEPIFTNPEKSQVSHSSRDEKSPQSAFVVSYLINSCGLSPENAVSSSRKLHFDGPEKPNLVVNFLQKSGFSKSQIAELVRKRPNLLVSNVEKTLSPKIDFYLNKTVLQVSDVCKLGSTYPSFLIRNCEHSIEPVYNYLKDVIGAERAGSLLKRGSWIFIYNLENRIVPNVEFLRKLGLAPQSLRSGLISCPWLFCLKLDELKELVDEVTGMGFDLSKIVFISALKARARSNKSLWNRSSQVYRRWGLSENDIRMAYMRHPGCMLISEKKLSKCYDLLVNKMGREAREVLKNPTTLCLSMEKRLLPRCSVLRLLCSKGLVKEHWSFSSVFTRSEKYFLMRFVERHANQLPQLYDVYRSSKERGQLV